MSILSGLLKITLHRFLEIWDPWLLTQCRLWWSEFTDLNMKWLASVDLEMHLLDVIRDLDTYYYVFNCYSTSIGEFSASASSSFIPRSSDSRSKSISDSPSNSPSELSSNRFSPACTTTMQSWTTGSYHQPWRTKTIQVSKQRDFPCDYRGIQYDFSHYSCRWIILRG